MRFLQMSARARLGSELADRAAWTPLTFSASTGSFIQNREF
jgi:hypothetical protein